MFEYSKPEESWCASIEILIHILVSWSVMVGGASEACHSLETSRPRRWLLNGSVSYWCLVWVALVVTFALLPQIMGRWTVVEWWGHLEAEDSQTLPTVIEFSWTFCTQRCWGHWNIFLLLLVPPVPLHSSPLISYIVKLIIILFNNI